MELLEAIRIVRNQWKIVLPLLALTLVLSLVMINRIETNYKATGSLTLLTSNLGTSFTPSEDNATRQENPYLNFQQSLQTTAQVLANSVSTDERKQDFEEQGLSSDFIVEVPQDPTQTILLPRLAVEVTADSPEKAEATRTELLNVLVEELERIQTEAGAPVETWIQAFPKTEGNALAIAGSKARTGLLVIGTGIALTLLAAFVIDGYKRSVRNTRRGETIEVAANADKAGVQPVKKAPATRTQRRTTPTRKRAPRNESNTVDLAKAEATSTHKD
jgi:hypothetical protein